MVLNCYFSLSTSNLLSSNTSLDGLTEDLARRYFCQIVAAVSYCHKLRVAHRDLKPENVVFFSNNQRVKLTDFGFSNKYKNFELKKYFLKIKNCEYMSTACS